DVDAVLAVAGDGGDVAELPAVGQLDPVRDHAIARLSGAQNDAHDMVLAIFSAVMKVGKLVLAQGTIGKIEASTTRRPCTPLTRPCVSVTAIGSSARPMRQVQEACHTPLVFFLTNSSSAAPSV